MKMSKPTRRRQIRRKKKGICQFLYDKLEDETFKLAQWTDKERGEFCLHWLHASSGSWCVETDSELFRLWALHKGRLTINENEKKKEAKYKTWKANFRCAMKSRYELEEIQDPPNSGRKDVKYWKFTDLSFVRQQTDRCQKENRDKDDDGDRRPEMTDTTKNSRRPYRSRRKTKLDFESDDVENRAVKRPGKEKHYDIDSELQRQDFNLLSAKDDNFMMPLDEEIESAHFMDILEQDKSAREELEHFRTPSYSHLNPVSIDELSMNPGSEMDFFLTNQIISNQMDACNRGLVYDYKDNSHQIGQFYVDPLPKRPDVSIL